MGARKVLRTFSVIQSSIFFTILMPIRRVGETVMCDQKSRTFGAAFVLLQGLVTALFPQTSVKFIKNMIGKNFDNAAELEAKPAYLRQLRALGVGMVAAAGTDLLLQSRAKTDDGQAVTGELDDGAGSEGDQDDEHRE